MQRVVPNGVTFAAPAGHVLFGTQLRMDTKAMCGGVRDYKSKRQHLHAVRAVRLRTFIPSRFPAADLPMQPRRNGMTTSTTGGAPTPRRRAIVMHATASQGAGAQS